MKTLCVLALTTLLSPSVLAQDSRPATQPNKPMANQLTDKEKEEGWVLLFDGKTTDQWRRYRREEFPSAGRVAKLITFLGGVGNSRVRFTGLKEPDSACPHVPHR